MLTPHDGEFARLAGGPPGPDRIDAARRLAGSCGAVVLLKGRATVVAAPSGEVLVTTTGDQRLATAGTGDVLTGVIGGLAAQGLDPFRAAAAGAFLHGRAGALGWRRGLVAGDLPDALPGRPRRGRRRCGPDGGSPRTEDRCCETCRWGTSCPPTWCPSRPDDDVRDAMRALLRRDVDAGPVLDADG